MVRLISVLIFQVGYEWPGFPLGVKFDPSDVELLDHLASKRGEGSLEPHVYIDEFIPSLEGEDGICYTHPENLPGELVKMLISYKLVML